MMALAWSLFCGKYKSFLMHHNKTYLMSARVIFRYWEFLGQIVCFKYKENNHTKKTLSFSHIFKSRYSILGSLVSMEVCLVLS